MQTHLIYVFTLSKYMYDVHFLAAIFVISSYLLLLHLRLFPLGKVDRPNSRSLSRSSSMSLETLSLHLFLGQPRSFSLHLGLHHLDWIEIVKFVLHDRTSAVWSHVPYLLRDLCYIELVLNVLTP